MHTCCSSPLLPLLPTPQHRIIFDEGHVLKARGTVQARACHSLVADRRWVVTGTPIDSEVDEFQGLLQALQVSCFQLSCNMPLTCVITCHA